MNPKTRNGFTLVELLVVVAIIVLLVAILLPALAKARMGAKRSRVSSQLHVISVALHAFANDMGEFPTSDAFGSADPRIDANYVPTGAHILAMALVGTPAGGLPMKNKNTYLSVKKANAVFDFFDDGNPANFPGKVEATKMFLLRDVSFDSPILYYRANRRARYSADPNFYASADFEPGMLNREAVYYLSDNGLITGSPETYGPLSSPPAGWPRSSPTFRDFNLDGTLWFFRNYVEVDGTRQPPPPPPLPPNPDGRYEKRDPVTARAQNDEEFLLIAGGADGIYGPVDVGPLMCDDIANFPAPTAGPDPADMP